MRRLLIAPLVTLTACAFDGSVLPAGALISCADDVDCPPDQRCSGGQCLATDVDAPSVAPLVVTLDEDTQATFTLTARDVLPAHAVFHLVDVPARGALLCADDVVVCAEGCDPPAACRVQDAQLTYRPDPDENGQDSFRVV